MTDRHSIAEMRRNLPALVREAERGRVVELTRRGEPVAVLMGRKHYDRLVSTRRSFVEAYREFTRDIDLYELTFDPDELFAGTREETPGRDVRL